MPLLLLLALLTAAPARTPEPLVGQVWVGGAAPRGPWPLGDPDLEGLERPRLAAWRAARLVQVRRPGWARRVPLHQLVVRAETADPAALDADAERLGVWFADRGYLDAEVRWELEPLGRRYQGVRFLVDPGEPYTLASVSARVEEDGLEEGLAARVRAALAPETPSPWRGERVGGAEEEALRILRRGGYALAVLHRDQRVEGTAVHLAWRVEHGPECLVGAVRVEGVDRLRAERVEAAATRALPPGERLRDRQVARLERGLGSLAALEEHSVEIVAGEDHHAPDVVIRLREAPAAHLEPTLRLGGHGWIGTAQVGAEGGWNGVAGGLADVRLSGAAGYGGTHFALTEDSGERGPVLDADLGVVLPVWASTRLDAYARAHAGADVTEGTRVAVASGEVGLAWRPTGPVTVEVGVGPGYALHWPSPPQEEAFHQRFGEEGFAVRALLLDPRVSVALDTRDDDLDPLRGALLRADVAPWGRWQGVRRGRLEADARAYLPVLDGLVVAVRGWGGLAEPAAHDAPQQLLQHRFHLGGGQAMRGWGWGRVATEGVEIGHSELRPGGNAALLAQLEPRIRIVPGLHGALFVDAGQVWVSLDEAKAADLRVGVGAGIRLDTPVGPARIDLAWAVGEPGLPLRVHPAIGATF